MPRIDTSVWSQPARRSTVTFRAKCKWIKDGSSKKFTAHFYIDPVQEIFVSIVGIGIIKIAEIWIQPDRALILNKINRIAYNKDADSIKDLLGLELSFDQIVSLLLAQLPTEIEGEEEWVGDQVLIRTSLNENMEALYRIDTKKKLWEALYIKSNEKELDSAEMVFANYQKIDDGLPMSIKRDIRMVAQNSEQSLQMELDRFALGKKQNIKLRIPNSYRVEK